MIVAALCIEVIWHEDNCEQSILRCAAQAACAPLLVAALQGYRSICWEAWQSELMLDLSPPPPNAPHLLCAALSETSPCGPAAGPDFQDGRPRMKTMAKIGHANGVVSVAGTVSLEPGVQFS